MTKVVILSGGKGTRLQELTNEIPKPLLMVGNKPILQHIIDIYVKGGFTDFIIPVGYLGGKVREYFRGKYEFVEEHADHLVVIGEKVNVAVIDTGFDTLTGGRLLRLQNYLENEPFMMTYGDGLSNLNPKYIKELGEELNKNIVTAIHPAPRFGGMTISPDLKVMSFAEKQVNPHEWINGGFMYLKPEIFNYMTKGDDTNLEKDVLPKVTWDSGLYAFEYEGYWACCDTLRDFIKMNDDCKNGEFKWVS